MQQQLKENPLGLQSLKDFPLRSKVNSFTKAFPFNCLKEKSVYKVTKDFPLTSKVNSHNSVLVFNYNNEIKQSLLFPGHKCPYYAKDGLGILESPNFPGEYPTGVECHWRVRPNRNKRVLILISSISLDSNCGDLLTIRKTGKFLVGKIL